MNLGGYTTLVTGAGVASAAASPWLSASRGAHVIIASRSETGQVVADEIIARGGRATWARCDVTLRSSVVGAMDSAITATGRLDAVIHNATSNASSHTASTRPTSTIRCGRTTFGVSAWRFHCAAASFSALSERGGTLLVMTSPAGIEGSATLPLYATMKGAMRGFAKSLAREWAPDRITVNVISPLAYSPAMTAAIEAEPAMEERLARRIPWDASAIRRADIGAVVAFLVGPDARYITGQTLGVDGGHYTNL